jgi:hypothetical protein
MAITNPPFWEGILEGLKKLPIAEAILATREENSLVALANGSMVIPTEVIELGASMVVGSDVRNLKLTFSYSAVKASFDVKRWPATLHVTVVGSNQRYVARAPIGDVVMDVEADHELGGGVLARIFGAILVAIVKGLFGPDFALRPLSQVSAITIDGKQLTCHLDQLQGVAGFLATGLGLVAGMGSIGSVGIIEFEDVVFVDGGVRVVAKLGSGLSKLHALAAAAKRRFP